jgi:iduronate 2-sulfatase
MRVIKAQILRTAVSLAGGIAAVAGSAVHAGEPHVLAPAISEATTPEARRQPNVLMIISDDLNTRLSSYGGPIVTPNIDRLGREGVRFDRAYVQYPWCAPSRASFLTGLRPDQIGVKDLQTPLRAKVPDVVTLPQFFKQQGYFSGRVGKVYHQGVPGGIGRSGPDDPASWDQVINPSGQDKVDENSIVNLTPGIGLGSAMAYRVDAGPGEEQTDGKVATETIRMIESNKDRPFFIAAGFYRPHHPFVAPKEYFDLYPLSQIKLAEETSQTKAGVLPSSRAVLPDNYGMAPDQQRRAIQGYYASTSFMDAQVGRILDAVERLGLKDDTIIVFMSDHGYLLGEHGQWTKKMLWEPSARAPLIIRVPGAAGNGTASPRLVEYLDLYPTLLDAAGLPGNQRNQGVSLMPLLQAPMSPAWTKPAFSQVKGGRSVRTERWRYTEWEGGKAGRELYDHVRDPGEHRNLARDPRHATVVAHLRAMLAPFAVEKAPQPLRYRPSEQCMELPPGVPPAVGNPCKGVQADIELPG